MVEGPLQSAELVDTHWYTGESCQTEYLCRPRPWTVDSEALKIISKCVFQGCSALATVDLAGCNLVKEIKEAAFQSCVSLQEVALPPKLQTIGRGAFAACKSLARVCCPPPYSLMVTTRLLVARLPIFIRVVSGRIDSEIRKDPNEKRMFVFPSQLNAAEYNNNVYDSTEIHSYAIKDELRNSSLGRKYRRKRAFDYTENGTTPFHRGFSSSSRDQVPGSDKHPTP